MTNLTFNAFSKQNKVLVSDKRFIGAFAGKRGGKTEVGGIWSIMEQEGRRDYVSNGIDPYLGVIVAPTTDMLARLSWKKFLAYAKPTGLIKKVRESPFRLIEWHSSREGDEHLIYGVSGDKPERIEGIKANWIWIDEVFQIKEQLFLECMARVSDTGGRILCTGSLGVQFVNPKQHWAYKYFKEQIDEEFGCFEWKTSENPHFPQDELIRAKNRLDRQTYEAMYEIQWDTIPSSAVYSEFSDDNTGDFKINPAWPTLCCVDWGWSHPMACGIFQIPPDGQVYLVKERVESKVKLEELAEWINNLGFPIQEYICDIAGNQEREQLGMSNIQWFRKNHSINFKYRSSSILEGVSLVRSYVKNANGLVRFFISNNCPKSQEGMRRYKYPEKDGKIVNENPIKEDDDAVDMIRYFFMYKLDPKYKNMKKIQMGSYR